MSRRREDGQAGAEILFFAFALLVPLVLIVANAWAVVDAKFTVTSAAREGARAFVESRDSEHAADEARGAVEAALVRAGARLERLQEVEVDGALERCTPVTVTVRYRVPTVRVPWFGVSFGTRLVIARHGELVDPYRSGLIGEAGGDCAS